MSSKHHCCHCDSCDVTYPACPHRWQLCTSCQLQDGHEYPTADAAGRSRPNTRRP